MDEKLLIVEDQFIVANDLKIMLEQAGYTVCGTADTVDTAKAAIDKYMPTFVLLDIFLQDDIMGTELAPYLQEKGIGFIYVSANTNQSVLEIAKATQPYGFLVKPFREDDLLIMVDIAKSRHESNLQFAAQRESLLQQHLRNIAEDPGSRDVKLLKLPDAFQSLIPFDFFALEYDAADQKKKEFAAFYRVGFNEYRVLAAEDINSVEELFYFKKDKAKKRQTDIKLLHGNPFWEFAGKSTSGLSLLQQFKLTSTLQLYSSDNEATLRLSFCNKNADVFDHFHTALLRKTEKAIFKLIAHIAETEEFKQPPVLRRMARTQPVQPTAAAPRFEGIYGNSAALLHVLDNIEMVANTPVSVLILGESGTGKEKVAYNIHLFSRRKNQPFITVNCAAMPAELIESELFGHEKGAFTGAVDKRIGKFEMANGGTIFLDEIGEMPLESQVKLLRVLQEKEFEHIGSSKSIKVDVRIVAATNRNLEKEVAEGRFRLDLFYRLNVYPIQLPPLRDRKDDIPLLARHFLVKSAADFGREQVPELSPAAIKQLTDHNWPGNIRELEHLMERMLIKARQGTIEIIELPVKSEESSHNPSAGSGKKTLEQIETEHILSVLKSCKGKINGAGGAAEILGLPPSTLTSRMKKLGIRKELYHRR